jgi:hypothetical protein
MEEWYGSREAAMKAVVLSQHRLIRALANTRLPFLQVDTRQQEWARYAESIVAYCLVLGASRTQRLLEAFQLR